MTFKSSIGYQINTGSSSRIRIILKSLSLICQLYLLLIYLKT